MLRPQAHRLMQQGAARCGLGDGALDEIEGVVPYMENAVLLQTDIRYAGGYHMYCPRSI